jgi:hypothetical protein
VIPSYSGFKTSSRTGNVTQYARQMDDVDRYPSERERALKATVLGLILGVCLAMLARRPRLT